MVTGAKRYLGEWGSGFSGVCRERPTAVGIGLVPGWVLSGVCGKVGYSFYSPLMGKVSFSTLSCLSLGEG